MDAARTASRLGVRDVTVIYRRSRAEMPAIDDEVEEALREGVEIQYLASPSRISRNNGRLDMECIRMKLGEADASGRPRPEPIAGSEFNVAADTVIVAIGETPDIPSQFGLKQVDGNRVWADPETLETNKKGVFAGGDAVSGPASIIESIAAGRRAAVSIDRYLGGKGNIDKQLAPPKGEVKPLDADELPEERRVPQASAMPLAKRLFSFDMPECGYTEEEAIKEASRCLRCDANGIYTSNEEKCKGCHNCMVLCPVPGCINMKTVG
jgi:NADPH-dependent glutamate synthase beta subunit-like oxidoreductase